MYMHAYNYMYIYISLSLSLSIYIYICIYALLKSGRKLLGWMQEWLATVYLRPVLD